MIPTHRLASPLTPETRATALAAHVLAASAPLSRQAIAARVDRGARLRARDIQRWGRRSRRAARRHAWAERRRAPGGDPRPLAVGLFAVLAALATLVGRR